MERHDPPVSGSERDLLLGFLQFLRRTVLVKCDGLDDAQLQTTLPPTTMTLGGMLAHLDFVEDYWIGHMFFGREPSEPWRSAPWQEDEDWDWHQAAERAGDELRTALVRRWQETDAAIAGTPLDALSALPHAGEQVSLRWILLHFLEEYGRHAGHADLLREAIDGSVGE